MLNWLRTLFGGGSTRNGGRVFDPPERIQAPPSDPAGFWAIIAQTEGKVREAQEAALRGALAGLDPDALIAFDADYRRALAQAYRWDLWAAAYAMNGGCSDDGFDYFCDWLISRGRATFEAALADPATLIGTARAMSEEDDAEFEELRYVVQEVYEEKTGRMMPILDMGGSRGQPAGDRWEEDEAETMFPELAEWANDRY